MREHNELCVLGLLPIKQILQVGDEVWVIKIFILRQDLRKRSKRVRNKHKGGMESTDEARSAQRLGTSEISRGKARLGGEAVGTYN